VQVQDVKQAGNDISHSRVQGIGGVLKPSEVAPCIDEPRQRLKSTEVEIFTLDNQKPSYIFKDNNNCQIINFVINGLDSKSTAVEILRSLGPVPFSS